MEEEIQEQPETAKVDVKAEQYNKPKDVRLPLPGSLQEIVGSLLFASDSPLSVAELRECVRGVEPENGDDAEVMEVYKTCTTREIEEALRGLEKALEVAKCGFTLVCTGGQYRLQTSPVCGRYVRALLKLDRPNRLSRASLETLAIIAYRQPITKAEVEQIRGVGVDTIMKTLTDLGLVRLVGRSELPGHPFLYGTTPFFLEHFGLASLDQLNEIDPTLPRSNPRERAKLFKREEKPAVEQPELTEAVAAAEAAQAASADDATPPEAAAKDENAADDDEEVSVADGAAPVVDDDDDIFIDDTPDEFDDEDDDDEDDDEEDSEIEEDGEAEESDDES
jgi:segregation and condensation protein B